MTDTNCQICNKPKISTQKAVGGYLYTTGYIIEGDIVKGLGCGHSFHQTCVNHLFSKYKEHNEKEKCPLCGKEHKIDNQIYSLLDAVMAQRWNEAGEILERNNDNKTLINFCYKKYETSLHHAVRLGNIEMTKKIISNKLTDRKINAEGSLFNEICTNFKLNSVADEFCNEMILVGDIDHTYSNYKNSDNFILACWAGFPKTAETLFDSGKYDLTRKTINGNTAFFHASKSSSMHKLAIKMCNSGKIDMSDQEKYVGDKNKLKYIAKIFNIVNGCDDEVVNATQTVDIKNVEKVHQTAQIIEVTNAEEIIQEAQTSNNVVGEVIDVTRLGC